jgi:hypothetical protein
MQLLQQADVVVYDDLGAQVGGQQGPAGAVGRTDKDVIKHHARIAHT